MIPKISLTVAILLLVAPPMVRASTRSSATAAATARQAKQSHPGILVAQMDQSSPGITGNDNGNDNDNDSNDDSDDNQNANGDQTDQQNAGTNQQADPQPISPDTDPGDAQPMNAYPQPMNPYQ